MQPSDLEPFGVGFPQLFTTSPTSRVSEWIDLCFFLHLPKFRGGSICLFSKKLSESLPNNKKTLEEKEGGSEFWQVKPCTFLLRFPKVDFPTIPETNSEGKHLKRCLLTQKGKDSSSNHGFSGENSYFWEG